jgi:hypothetical protein
MNMDKEEVIFNKIAEKLTEKEKHVALGKMMSSPGIKYKDKVFAFYFQKEMIFKLGEDFNPAKLNIKNFKLLSPFKTKAPLKAWFQIPFSERDKWEELTKIALEKISSK